VPQRRKNRTNSEHLSRRNDIQRLFKESSKVALKGFRLIYRENQLDCNRIVVIVKKGFTRAVDRNKQRRRAKEVYRHLQSVLKKGFDIGLLIPPGRFHYNDMYTIVKRLFSDANLLQG
jgi:ribonuclease P protein component